MENLNFENANVFYQKEFLTLSESKDVFDSISDLFQHEERKIINDENDQPLYRLNRKTIVFVDDMVDKIVIPKIWGNNVTVLSFPPILAEIKKNLESKLNFEFNICLANYYPNGKSNIAWHSDNEEKGSTSCIASISLGEEREFTFRKKETSNIEIPREIYKSLILHSGSLIVMADGCQENYHHSLPSNNKYKNPRLNLTFRLFDSSRYEKY